MTWHMDYYVLEKQFASCSFTGLANTSQIPTPSAIGCMMGLHNKEQCSEYQYYWLFIQTGNFGTGETFVRMFALWSD